jgi:hypothetical protein
MSSIPDTDAIITPATPEHIPFILEPWETADKVAEEVRKKFQHYATASPVDRAKLDLLALLLGIVKLEGVTDDNSQLEIDTWVKLNDMLDYYSRTFLHPAMLAELRRQQ